MPGAIEVAATLNNLGIVALERGDFAKADEYYGRALDIRARLVPGTLVVAESLSNLAGVAAQRGDLSKADEYHRQALSIEKKAAPGSLDVAATLNDLGIISFDRGDLARADAYLRQALVIQQRLAPGSLDVAATLENLGEVARDRGDLVHAEHHGRQALAIQRQLAPDSGDIATTYHALADIALRRGDINKAEQLCHKALSIWERGAAGSKQQAESVALLARILRARGELETASRLSIEALGILDRQASRLGGTHEIRSRFRASYAGYYQDAIDLLLTEGKAADSFGVFERSRARSLLEMLAERDLVFAADLPVDIRIARQRNAAAYDRTQAQIASLSPGADAAKLEQLRKRLGELERERDEITERVRRTSPRLAAIQYPEPLDLGETRKILDPGTLLLSYSVGSDHTTLFAVSAVGQEPGLFFFKLPVSGKNLRARITELRRLIQVADADNAVATALKQLYELLISPAEPLIATSSRLLIVPDGPLQALPFGALIRSSGQYLIEWKPLHTAVSATVYAELKARRDGQATRPIALAAFGDAVYSTEERTGSPSLASSQFQAATERGFTLSRLLFSGPEVERIASVFPGQCRKYLRSEATEEHAKALGKDVRYIHFATHAFLDERLPLNSAVILSIPQRPRSGCDNGWLQAWEIFEELRIDGDLVTLSGCNTALGQELAGEGLIGLVRAFQYAGAHSVLASLWNVDDRKTSLLMERFYRELRDGKTKDESLRAAQIGLLRSRHGTRPFYWAGFVLNGDWR